MIGKTIAELAPGDHAELARQVEEDDIAGFVDAVGDYNPVHSDADYAATTPFKEPIAPGIFTAGLISAVIGTQLPGPGAIYLSQSLKFVKPVKAGDTITAQVHVLEVVRERNRIRLQTVCVNQRGEEVLSGEAWVMPSRADRLRGAAPPRRIARGARGPAMDAGGPRHAAVRPPSLHQQAAVDRELGAGDVVAVGRDEIDDGAPHLLRRPEALQRDLVESRSRTLSGMPWTISVSMKPGATALTVTPLPASSLASDLVNAATPAFEAA